MNKVQHFDEIRKQILVYLDGVMDKALNQNKARVTDVMIQRALLSQHKIEGNETNRELMYLLEKRYIKKTKESYGSGKNKGYTTYYHISDTGRDFLHGSSEAFKSTSNFGGIKITNINGAVAIGQSNVAIVQKSNVQLFTLLDELRDGVMGSEEISDPDKGDIIADIDTLKSQVAKTKPNLDIVKMAWLGLSTLSNIEGLMQFYDRIKPLIEGLIR